MNMQRANEMLGGKPAMCLRWSSDRRANPITRAEAAAMIRGNRNAVSPVRRVRKVGATVCIATGSITAYIQPVAPASLVLPAWPFYHGA